MLGWIPEVATVHVAHRTGGLAYAREVFEEVDAAAESVWVRGILRLFAAGLFREAPDRYLVGLRGTEDLLVAGIRHPERFVRRLISFPETLEQAAQRASAVV